MASTTKTPNYDLSQFADDDIPQWRTDYNGDMTKIDTAIKDIDDKVLTADIVGTGDVDVFVDTQNIKDGAITDDKINTSAKLYYESGEVITIPAAVLACEVESGGNLLNITLPLSRNTSKVSAATVRLTGTLPNYFFTLSGGGMGRPTINKDYHGPVTEIGVNFKTEITEPTGVTQYQLGSVQLGPIQVTFD